MQITVTLNDPRPTNLSLELDVLTAQGLKKLLQDRSTSRCNVEELQGLNQLTSLMNAMEIPQPYNPDRHASKRNR